VSRITPEIFWDVRQRILVVTDVFGQIIGCICRGQAFYLDCLTLEDVTDSLSQNVVNYHSTLSNIPEERPSYLHCGASLKSRITHVEIGLIPVLKRQ
jgi:hypothetical protein